MTNLKNELVSAIENQFDVNTLLLEFSPCGKDVVVIYNSNGTDELHQIDFPTPHPRCPIDEYIQHVFTAKPADIPNFMPDF